MAEEIGYLFYGEALDCSIRLFYTVDQGCCERVPKLVEAENRVMLVVAKKYDILYRLWFLYHSLFSFIGGSFRGA